MTELGQRFDAVRSSVEPIEVREKPESIVKGITIPNIIVSLPEGLLTTEDVLHELRLTSGVKDPDKYRDLIDDLINNDSGLVQGDNNE